MKKIFFISAGRSDFDRLENILSELDNSKKIILYVFLTTEYYNKFFTYNLKKIKKKFNVLNNKKKSKHFEDTPFQMIKNLSEDLFSLSEHVKKLKPDLILIAGDRYEMLLGPLVAIPNNIPTFHFFGGSITEGAIDELIRHGLTKMSHFHYTILKKYKERVLQLGEKRNNIFNVGSLGVEAFSKSKVLSKNEIEKKLKIRFSKKNYVICINSTTYGNENINHLLKNLFSALNEIKDCTIIFTLPNSDLKSDTITKKIKYFCKINKNAFYFKNLGHVYFKSVLKKLTSRIFSGGFEQCFKTLSIK